MSTPRTILARLPSFCQKISKSVEIWRSSAQFFWDTLYNMVTMLVQTYYRTPCCRCQWKRQSWQLPTPGEISPICLNMWRITSTKIFVQIFVCFENFSRVPKTRLYLQLQIPVSPKYRPAGLWFIPVEPKYRLGNFAEKKLLQIMLCLGAPGLGTPCCGSSGVRGLPPKIKL